VNGGSLPTAAKSSLCTSIVAVETCLFAVIA
jgi:hypothetical protein